MGYYSLDRNPNRNRNRNPGRSAERSRGEPPPCQCGPRPRLRLRLRLRAGARAPCKDLSRLDVARGGKLSQETIYTLTPPDAGMQRASYRRMVLFLFGENNARRECFGRHHLASICPTLRTQPGAQRIPFRVKTFLTVAALFLAACAPFRVGSIRVGYSAAGHIAKDMSIPGKGVSGECLPFALALQQKFEAAGIPSKIIAYSYEAMSPARFIDRSQPTPAIGRADSYSGAHAIVEYNDDGRIYIMDNQSWSPTWVHEASNAGLAQQFGGTNISIRKARIVDEKTTFLSASTGSTPDRADSH
jgi:hypothetical protein